jgi:peptide deformylase
MMTNEEIDQLQLVNELDPILKTKLDKFDFDKMDARYFAERLMKIMVACHGAGLSANQVGVNTQMFVMQWPTIAEQQAGSRIVINPEILGVTESETMFEEGCLSFPALFIWLKRPEAISVRYQDILGETIEETLYGWPARIFQHEYDHIQGLTFDQKASTLKLNMAQKKRSKVFKKAGVNYNKVLHG